MSIEDWKRFRRMVLRRIQISKTATKEELARDHASKPMLDYHAGCIGMGECLIDDIDRRLKRVRR